MLRIGSNESIETTATIDRSESSFSTNFEAKSGYGNLTETLFEQSDARTIYLAEASITGNLSLTSRVSDKLELQNIYEVDQMGKLNAAKTMGDSGVDESVYESGYTKTTEEEANSLLQNALGLLESAKTEQKDYQKALADCDRVLELSPGSKIESHAWYIKGILYGERNYFAYAVDAYNHAISLDPENRDAWLSKAMALGEDNKKQDALDVLNKTLEKFPDYANAWLQKGTFLKDIGILDEAMASANNAIKLEPDSGNAYLLKGIVYYKKSLSCNCKNYCSEAGDALSLSKTLGANDGNSSIADEYILKLESICDETNQEKKNTNGKTDVITTSQGIVESADPSRDELRSANGSLNNSTQAAP